LKASDVNLDATFTSNFLSEFERETVGIVQSKSTFTADLGFAFALHLSNDFLKQFCRKLLGYSLARGVQFSDEPLLEEMMTSLKSSNYRFSAAIETIVRSQQFRFHRRNAVE
jgi:hypothetical protein